MIFFEGLLLIIKEAISTIFQILPSEGYSTNSFKFEYSLLGLMSVLLDQGWWQYFKSNSKAEAKLR